MRSALLFVVLVLLLAGAGCLRPASPAEDSPHLPVSEILYTTQMDDLHALAPYVYEWNRPTLHEESKMWTVAGMGCWPESQKVFHLTLRVHDDPFEIFDYALAETGKPC